MMIYENENDGDDVDVLCDVDVDVDVLCDVDDDDKYDDVACDFTSRS